MATDRDGFVATGENRVFSMRDRVGSLNDTRPTGIRRSMLYYVLQHPTMSLEHDGDSDEKSAAERLAELTGEPVEKFEYDGPIPELDDLERERVSE